MWQNKCRFHITDASQKLSFTNNSEDKSRIAIRQPTNHVICSCGRSRLYPSFHIFCAKPDLIRFNSYFDFIQRIFLKSILPYNFTNSRVWHWQLLWFGRVWNVTYIMAERKFKNILFLITYWNKNTCWKKKSLKQWFACNQIKNWYLL